MDSKISELTELTTPADEDLLAIVDDPEGSPATKKITFENLKANVDSYEHWIMGETPTGTVNGTNTAFDTANNYISGKIEVFRDGQRMEGGGEDYTETDANTITFTTAPVMGSVITVNYLKAGVATGDADTLDGQHAPTGTIVGTTDTQTLTNKTLTSPLYQGLIDGWVSANETWTRESDTSFSEAIDATNKYQKGDKLRYKQGGAYKYQYVISVGAYSGGKTIITTTGGSDYVFTSGTAITDNYYSKVENPQGFPGSFNYTPVLTASTDTIPVFSTISARFTISQNLINIIFSMTGDGGTDGSGTNPLEISLPVSIFNGGNGVFTWASASSSGVGVFLYSLSGKTQFRKNPTTPVTPNDFPNGERYIMGHIVGNF